MVKLIIDNIYWFCRENILNILGYSFKDTISCTVDEIYKKIGLDINNMVKLVF